jgi:hypothetical protein
MILVTPAPPKADKSSCIFPLEAAKSKLPALLAGGAHVLLDPVGHRSGHDAGRHDCRCPDNGAAGCGVLVAAFLMVFSHPRRSGRHRRWSQCAERGYGRPASLSASFCRKHQAKMMPDQIGVIFFLSPRYTADRNPCRRLFISLPSMGPSSGSGRWSTISLNRWPNTLRSAD